MKDRALGIWLIVMFGVSGLAVLSWLWPALAADRLSATAAGGFGLAVAGLRAMMLRQSGGDNSGRRMPVNVEVED